MTVFANEIIDPTQVTSGIVTDIDAHQRQMAPRVQTLKRYWDLHRNAQTRIPCIDDVELMDIYQISTFIAMADVADNDSEFINRFWGGELTWRFAFEGTGKPVLSCQPACFGEKLLERYRRVVQTQLPLWEKAMMVRGRYNAHLPVEALHLPLTGKDRTHVKHVLSIFDFTSEPSSR